MQRDKSLIKQLLAEIANAKTEGLPAYALHINLRNGTPPNYPDERPGLTIEEVTYHLGLCIQAELLTFRQSTQMHKGAEYVVTYQGHDYLDFEGNQ